MQSLNQQGSSDEESGANHNYNQRLLLQLDGEERRIKFLKKWFGWICSLSMPAVIGIAAYLQFKKSKIAKVLLHFSTILMLLGFLSASMLYILAHKIHGRAGFVKRLTCFSVLILSSSSQLPGTSPRRKTWRAPLGQGFHHPLITLAALYESTSASVLTTSEINQPFCHSEKKSNNRQVKRHCDGDEIVFEGAYGSPSGCEDESQYHEERGGVQRSLAFLF